MITHSMLASCTGFSVLCDTRATKFACTSNPCDNTQYTHPIRLHYQHTHTLDIVLQFSKVRRTCLGTAHKRCPANKTQTCAVDSQQYEAASHTKRTLQPPRCTTAKFYSLQSQSNTISEAAKTNMDKNSDVSFICTLSSSLSSLEPAPFTLAQLRDELLADNIPVYSIEQRAIKPSTYPTQFEFLVTVDAPHADRVRAICKRHVCTIRMVDDKPKPTDAAWYPRSLTDLDENCKNIFTYGVELDSDHPGFHDAEYRERR